MAKPCPMHTRGPPPNGKKAKRGSAAVSVPSQRSGRNAWGSGKKPGRRCTAHWLVSSSDPAGTRMLPDPAPAHGPPPRHPERGIKAKCFLDDGLGVRKIGKVVRRGGSVPNHPLKFRRQPRIRLRVLRQHQKRPGERQRRTLVAGGEEGLDLLAQRPRASRPGSQLRQAAWALPPPPARRPRSNRPPVGPVAAPPPPRAAWAAAAAARRGCGPH